MAQQFFVFIFAVIIIFVAFVFFKIALPMYRFVVRHDAITLSYHLLKNILHQNFSSEKPTIYTLKYVGYKFKITFSNSYELGMELEKSINEALEYYDKLGIISIIVNDYEIRKRELIEICFEIRRLRWRNQEN